jgi:hypothetical protein
MTKGVLEAWSEAVGEQLDALAGFRFTRTTAQVAEGDTAWPLETTYGWPNAGRFFVDGDVYRYTAKTDTGVSGVRWDDPAFALPVTGRLTAPATSVQATYFKSAVIRMALTGTWAGSMELEVSKDGVTWATYNTGITANTTVDVALADYPKLRLRSTSLTSGAANVVMLPLPQGDGTPQPVAGFLAAGGQVINTVLIPRAVLAVTITGTWVGTLTVEQSADGAAWTALGAYTANAAVEVAVSQPQVRVRASPWTSGRADLSLVVVARSGARRTVPVASHVVDYSRTFSALDSMRDQVFVDTAVGDYLSALGRSLGVRRPPNLSNDDDFRKVIKAMAYLPKGTMQGLELAMTAFFGAGNFKVWEDFPTFRNTVFIQLLNGINLAESANGQTYLTRSAPRSLDTAAKTLTLATPGVSPTTEGPVLAVMGARLLDEGRYDLLTTTRPSGISDYLYPGGPLTAVWLYSGTTEASVSAMALATGMTLTTTAGQTALYARTARIRPESNASITVTGRVSAASGTAAGSGKQWTFGLRDGARDLAVGAIASGANIQFGLISTSTGQFLAGAAVVVALGTEVHLTLRKTGAQVDLLWNGVVVQSATAVDFPASAVNEFRMGHTDGTYAVTSTTKVLAFSAVTLTDYWNISGNIGTTVGTNQLNTSSGGNIQTGDVGKAVRTVSTAFPKNTGLWLVDTVLSTDNMTLKGVIRKHAGVASLGVAGAAPHRITVAGIPDAFTYPQDVGKQIEIMGSAGGLGNNGVFVISQLMLPDAPGTAISGSLTQQTNVCEVATAPAGGFDVETGLNWRLIPNWGTPDTTLYWELADAGSFAGMVLTLRANPPLTIPGGYVVAMLVTYSTVKSGQVLLAADVANDPAGAWFPIYLPGHPMGAYAQYLAELTVAGVIPEVLLG